MEVDLGLESSRRGLVVGILIWNCLTTRIEIFVLETNGQHHKISYTIRIEGSFGAGSLLGNIGLGNSKKIIQINVRWPNAIRTMETHKNFFINKFYRSVEGEKSQVLDKEHNHFTEI